MSKKVPKAKRTIIRVQWMKRPRRWRVKAKGPMAEGVPEALFVLKSSAMADARLAGNIIRDEGYYAQCLFYTKRGRIGKGRNAEASYGCDSKSPG